MRGKKIYKYREIASPKWAFGHGPFYPQKSQQRREKKDGLDILIGGLHRGHRSPEHDPDDRIRTVRHCGQHFLRGRHPAGAAGEGVQGPAGALKKHSDLAGETEALELGWSRRPVLRNE